ncbi:unnamed protein product [Urochloa humidicola]
MGLTSSTSAGATNTTPAIIGETATVSLTLHIPSYSTTKGIGVGRSLNSGTFTAGGHSWHVAYFPDGKHNDCSDWISVFLYLDQPAAALDDAVSVYFQFSLRDPYGALVYGKFNPVVATFSFAEGGTRHWGYRRFVKKWKLESWWWRYMQLGGEGFQIRCDVTVLGRGGRQQVAGMAPSPVVVPPPPPHRWPVARFSRCIGIWFAAQLLIFFMAELFRR